MKKSLLWILLLAVSMISGCRSVSKTESGQVAVNVMDESASEQGRALAEKFARGLEKSLRTGEPAHWRAVMPPQQAKSLTMEIFQKTKDNLEGKYGKFQRVSPLGVLNQGIVHYHLWKLHFIYQPDKSAPAIPREGLFWIRVLQEKGKDTTLDYFGYMPF